MRVKKQKSPTFLTKHGAPKFISTRQTCATRHNSARRKWWRFLFLLGSDTRLQKPVFWIKPMTAIRLLIVLSSLGVTASQNSQTLDRVKDLESIQRSIEKNTLDETYRKALKLSCQTHASVTYAALRKGEKQAILQVYGNGCGEQRFIFVFEWHDGFWGLV